MSLSLGKACVFCRFTEMTMLLSFKAPVMSLSPHVAMSNSRKVHVTMSNLVVLTDYIIISRDGSPFSG